LSVPVLRARKKQLIRQIEIDYAQKWLTDHWRTIHSAYGKAPFFEYFASFFENIFLRKYKYLFDLNLDLLTTTYKIEADPCQDDFRSRIHPKISFRQNNIYDPLPYSQNFGNNFVPNVSIIDVLFCEGTQSLNIIRQSLMQ
jgi:hypothetical protein